MTRTSSHGLWNELVERVHALADDHGGVGLWWREPAPDVRLARPLMATGAGLPKDLQDWPDPLECWFWFGHATMAPENRRALHGLRRESGPEWDWVELQPPARDLNDSRVWALGAGDARSDVHRYGVTFAGGLQAGQALIRSADPASGWLWLGIDTGASQT